MSINKSCEPVFESVTVFILSNNEDELLRETVSLINENVDRKDIDKLVIVAKNDSCNGYRVGKEIAEDKENGNITVYVQKSADIVSCFAELPPLVGGSHFILMCADLENDPRTVKELVEKAKEKPGAIICAAKWLKDSVVKNYGAFRSICSRAVNTFVSIIYGGEIKDPFSIFQIYPMSVYEKMNFTLTPDFLYEYTLKPISKGVEYIEIPTLYTRRSMGKSNFGLFNEIIVALKYCFSALKLRIKH